MPFHAHFGSEIWLHQAGPTVALLLVGCLYLWGWTRLRLSLATSISMRRAASFLSGLLLIWLAVGSPLAGLDMELLTAHMIQHLLLMTLAPPLILLGSPSEPFLNALPLDFRRRFVDRLSRQDWLRRFATVLLQPAVCWLASAATLVVWHIPGLFALAMHSQSLHVFEQLTFLASGLLFWWPVVRYTTGVATQSGWLVLLYLFLATIPCDILSAFLVFSERVVYPVYFSAPRLLCL